MTNLTPCPDCPRCGWNYSEATLAMYARGEIKLDTNPTHFCPPPSKMS